MVEPEIPLSGSRSRVRVRVGDTVRREGYSWSATLLDLLRHLEREGFAGAPRALGLDDQGREVLTYVVGDVVGRGDRLGDRGRFDSRFPDYVWDDDALVHLGALVRAYHDAAAMFPWAGREWCFDARQPVETVCHNELHPSNIVFRAGVPVALIDWDTAAPTPRAWDLGFMAWRWVPFWRDEKCRAHGLQTGVAEKARRFRLVLDAYGVEPDIGVVRAGIERSREFLEQLHRLGPDGSGSEVELDYRAACDELALEIAWVEQHAVALVEL